MEWPGGKGRKGWVGLVWFGLVSQVYTGGIEKKNGDSTM